jgi:hypothetical protein
MFLLRRLNSSSSPVSANFVPKQAVVRCAATAVLASGSGGTKAQPTVTFDAVQRLLQGGTTKQLMTLLSDEAGVTPESIDMLAQAVTSKAAAPPDMNNVVVFSRSVLNHRLAQGGAQGVDAPLLDSLARLVASTLERSAVDSLLASALGAVQFNTVPTPHPSRVLRAFSAQLKALPDVRLQEPSKDSPDLQKALAALHAKISSAVDQKMVDLIAEGGLGPEESPGPKILLERTLPAVADIVEAHRRLGFSLSPALLEVIRRRFGACLEAYSSARFDISSSSSTNGTHGRHILAILQGLRWVGCVDAELLMVALRAASDASYSDQLTDYLIQALAEVQLPSTYSAEAAKFLQARLNSFATRSSLKSALSSSKGDDPTVVNFISLLDRCCEAGVEIPQLFEVLDPILYDLLLTARFSSYGFPSSYFVYLTGMEQISVDSLEVKGTEKLFRYFVGRHLQYATLSQRRQIEQQDATPAKAGASSGGAKKKEEEEDIEDDLYSPWYSSYNFQRLVSRVACKKGLASGLYLYDGGALASKDKLEDDDAGVRRLLREVVLRQAGGVKMHGLEPCWWRGPNINMVVLIEPSSSSTTAAAAGAVSPPAVPSVEQPPLSPRLLLQDKALKAVLGKAAPTEKGLVGGSTLPPLTVIRIKEDQLKRSKDEKGGAVVDVTAIDRAFEEAGVWQKLVDAGRAKVILHNNEQKDTTDTTTEPSKGQKDATGNTTEPSKGQKDTTDTTTEPSKEQKDATGNTTNPGFLAGIWSSLTGR